MAAVRTSPALRASAASAALVLEARSSLRTAPLASEAFTLRRSQRSALRTVLDGPRVTLFHARPAAVATAAG